jgi:hypothetical protein
MITISFGRVDGLPEEEQKWLDDLVFIYNYHQASNAKKQRYYNGKISLSEVNLGIALPSTLSGLEIGCSWGAKTVDVLAAHSMFDGFVTENGTDSAEMAAIMQRNHLIAEYNKAVKEELKYGCAFAAVSGAAGDARVRFYSPNCAAAAWNASEGRIKYGFAFEDNRRDESDVTWTPDNVNFYTDTDIWMLEKQGVGWHATQYPHRFKEPLMVAFVWDATNDKPFGQSRLKAAIRRLIQSYVRTIANATIGLEFATSPQKYLLGISDEQYDKLTETRFQHYVGSILLSTDNPETGEKPDFGQLSQGSIEPHVSMLRMLATQFSAATGLTVTDTGVVNDANPTSSEAIIAQSQTLILLAEQLNTGNGDALCRIGKMALAIEYGTTPDALPDNANSIVAHFKNPAMPSVAVTSDAAIKIASARPEFAGTDTFLEMIGFDQADIRRIKAQEQRQRGDAILQAEFSEVEPKNEPNEAGEPAEDIDNEDNAEGVE